MNRMELKALLRDLVADHGIIRPLDLLSDIALEYASQDNTEAGKREWLAVVDALDTIVEERKK